MSGASLAAADDLRCWRPWLDRTVAERGLGFADATDAQLDDPLPATAIEATTRKDYTLMWTIDSLGWNHLPARPIVERCLSRAAPGATYIFHVGAESQDAQALESIIDGLRARGLGFAQSRTCSASKVPTAHSL